MTRDDGDDDDFINKYRESSLEHPDQALNRKILLAAGGARIRKTLLPMALAVAASLTLVWVAIWHAASPAVSSNRAAGSEVVPGLYEGRIAEELADPAVTRQSTFEQMPGGAEREANHGS